VVFGIGSGANSYNLKAPPFGTYSMAGNLAGWGTNILEHELTT